MNTAHAVSTAAGLPGLEGLGSKQLLEKYRESLMGVFGTPQRVLVRGKGCTVWDADGREYLDLLGGIAVNALGHAVEFLTGIVADQLSTLGHVSNFFTSPAQIALAERLRAAVAGKKQGHGIGDPGFVQPDRPMSAIGG